MSAGRLRGWAAFLAICLALAASSCTARKQVPFGRGDAGTTPNEPASETDEEGIQPPVGVSFGPDQVEVPVADSTLVLKSGYALAALDVELDGREPVDAVVVSADREQVQLHAAFSRGVAAASRRVDGFELPTGCADPRAEVRQLSPSLVGVRVELACDEGTRTDAWVMTIEAQPRSRERITVHPPNASSTAPMAVQLHVEDRDVDGYEDLVAEVRIGELAVPLTWLDRPGGFARDGSQPEATFREQADAAWRSVRTNPGGALKTSLAVIDAFTALCREGGAARIGLSGTVGLPCKRSSAVARAVAIATAGSVRRGELVRALELQRRWDSVGAQPTPEERELVQAAWRGANAGHGATWRLVDNAQSRASLHFRDDDTLVVGGRAPREIQLSTGQKTALSGPSAVPAARSPDGRFFVRGVHVTCAGFEAEVAPVGGKQTHRIPIERRSDRRPCSLAVDRAATVFEWAVLGWAPQGLLAASGDLLRIIPLNAFAKPAGKPIDLSPGSPLPAPIRGTRITTDGSRYLIAHRQGVFVRDWRKGHTGLWLRPPDWNDVPGELRSVAISPSGNRVALQKGREIRVLAW